MLTNKSKCLFLSILLECAFFFSFNNSVFCNNNIQNASNILGKNNLKELEVSKPVDIDASPKPFNYSNTIFGNIPAFPLTKEVKSGILVNLNTREVLWAKKPITPVEIASMTKMMSLLLFLKAIQLNPQISLNSIVRVTKEASRVAGSGVHFRQGERFSIKTLIETILVHSANDSTYLLSQYFSGGNVNNFVTMMNNESKRLGLTATYYNCDGLPEKATNHDNKGSAQDMAFLAEKLLKFPLITSIAKQRQITIKSVSNQVRTFSSSNWLARYGFPGINGMKTGYTEGAGFCITATCNRDGKIFIVVLTGLKKVGDRYTLPKQLLSWAYKGGKPKIESNTNNKHHQKFKKKKMKNES